MIGVEDGTRWMQRALALAAKGRASTHPNPRVGCVIVRKGVVVAEGWHATAGGPHAEVVALQAAGDRARGADVYVTLEPCSHYGRTPPCVEALIGAGIKRIYAAMADPNPQVAGSGIRQLRKAGIMVEVGLCEDEALVLNRGFVSRMTRGRPWLTLKLAASLDGRTAMASGESQWITGEAAREEVHRLRAEAGAVLTSSATVLADDPQLTVRLPGEWRQPDRIVLDGRGRVPETAAVWSDDARRLALMSSAAPASLRTALAARGVEMPTLDTRADGAIVLSSALQVLGDAEINHLLVECGPHLAGALLTEKLVDEMLLYIAPCLLGENARPLAQLPGLESLTQVPRFEWVSALPVGEDLRLLLRPKY